MSYRPPESQTSQKGFTLAELLIAVTLVVVIGSVLLGAVHQVRKRAQETSCISNLRQTGTGLLLYAGASNGEIRTLYGGGYGNRTWSKILLEQGYLPDKKTMRCPTGETSYELDSKTWDWQVFGMNMQTGTGIVETVEVTGGNKDRIYRLRLQNVKDHRTHILLSDSATNNDNRYQSFRMFTNNPATGVHLRHRKMANVFFLDGHVEVLDRLALKQLAPEKFLLD